jgi:hypothetical protein
MSYLFGGFGAILFIAAILVFIAWKPLGEPAPAVANLALAIVLVIVWIAQASFNFWQGMFPQSWTAFHLHAYVVCRFLNFQGHGFHQYDAA